MGCLWYVDVVAMVNGKKDVLNGLREEEMVKLKPGDLVKTRPLGRATMWTFDLGDKPNTRVVQSIKDSPFNSKIAGDQYVVVLELVEVDGKLHFMKPHPSWLALDTRHFVKVLDVASQRLGWVQDVALTLQ